MTIHFSVWESILAGKWRDLNLGHQTPSGRGEGGFRPNRDFSHSVKCFTEFNPKKGGGLELPGRVGGG